VTRKGAWAYIAVMLLLAQALIACFMAFDFATNHPLFAWGCLGIDIIGSGVVIAVGATHV
jgi:hypothetical protein